MNKFSPRVKRKAIPTKSKPLDYIGGVNYIGGVK